MEAVIMHLMMGLKCKARILVNQGVVLMGTLDHTNELPEETVFLQVGLIKDVTPQVPTSATY